MEKVNQIEYQNQLYDIQDAEAQKNLVYSYVETDTGKIWIDGSRIFRKVIDCGQLPSNSKKVVSTGIKIKVLITLRGVAFSPSLNRYILLPLASPINHDISVTIQNNNIEIESNYDRASYTSSHVILEYTKAE